MSTSSVAMQWSYAPGFSALRVGWEHTSGQVGLIELNRPKKSNAFDGSMFEELVRVRAPKAWAAAAVQLCRCHHRAASHLGCDSASSLIHHRDCSCCGSVTTHEW